MARRQLLCHMPAGSVRPVIVQGASLLSHYRQLVRTLQAALGDEIASLFAEPVIDASGAIDWYAALDGQIQPVGHLPMDQQVAAQHKAAEAFERVLEHANTLRAGKGAAPHSIADLLEKMASAAQVQQLFQIGSAIVVAGWGVVSTLDGAENQQITRAGKGVAPPIGLVPSGGGESTGQAPVQTAGQAPLHATGTIGKRLWLWPLLAILLMALLALLLMRSCVGGADLVSSDFDQLIRSRGGQENGEVSFSLAWKNRDDLDLVVISPSGEVVYFGDNKASSGGLLDIDSNNSKDNLGESPIENIVWSHGAPDGSYKVFVLHYLSRVGQETPFQVRVKINGSDKIISGSVAPAEPGESFRRLTSGNYQSGHQGTGFVYLGEFSRP